ncbi:MAG: chorismate mutase [Bacillota bacterium]
MNVRGIRGAIDVPQNDAGEILKATRELLQEMVKKNSIGSDTIAAVFFSTTTDLNAAFPATAARQLGWTYVPLFSSVEIDVPGALPRCIRVLILLNTKKTQEEIHHVYLRGSRVLRPDLVED